MQVHSLRILKNGKNETKESGRSGGGEKEEEDASNANHAAGLGHGSIPTIEYVSIEELSKASAGAAAAFATSLDLGGNGEWENEKSGGGGAKHQTTKPAKYQDQSCRLRGQGCCRHRPLHGKAAVRW